MKKTTCTNLAAILNTATPVTTLNFVDENGNAHTQNIIIPRDANGAVDQLALVEVVFSVMYQLHLGRQGINYPQNVTIPLNANGAVDREALRTLNRTLVPRPPVPTPP